MDARLSNKPPFNLKFTMVFQRISTRSAPNLELKFRIMHNFYCCTIEYRLFQIIFKLGFTVCNDVPPGVTGVPDK